MSIHSTLAENDTLVALPVDAPRPARTASPLVERLVDSFGAQWVDAAGVAAWAAREGDHVVLLAGDPVRFPEGLDVAAVLPELQRQFARRFDIGVVARADEDAVASRYGVQRWPSLLFLRSGEYVATVAGMHDWSVFVDKVAEVLCAAPTRAPARIIPLATGSSATAGCH